MDGSTVRGYASKAPLCGPAGILTRERTSRQGGWNWEARERPRSVHDRHEADVSERSDAGIDEFASVGYCRPAPRRIRSRMRS